MIAYRLVPIFVALLLFSFSPADAAKVRASIDKASLDISPGQCLNESLGPPDSTFTDGTYYDEFTLIWPGGDLTISIDSAVFDEYLVVIDPNLVKTDIDYYFTAPEVFMVPAAPAGTYSIFGTSALVATGAYQVCVSDVGGPTPTQTPTLTPIETPTPTVTATNTIPSGPTPTPTITNTPGGPTPTLVRADYNSDGFVDSLDLLPLVADRKTPSPPTDLNGNGVVDSHDNWLFSQAWFGKNRQVIPGRTAEIADILHEVESQKRLFNENFPILMRPGADYYYPEVADLIAFGPDAVDSILDSFRQPAEFVDDIPLCLLAYALERIGDPRAVPVLADWLETNMFAELLWATDFVTHTIKVLDGQGDLNTVSFTYLVDQKFDAIEQARVGASAKHAGLSPIQKDAGGSLEKICPKTIHVTGIDANGQQRTLSMSFNVSERDIQERIAAATGPTKATLIGLANGYAERDEKVYGGSDYLPVDGATVSTRANCAGIVIQKVFNELLLRKGIPISLGPGTSNTTSLRDVALAFADEVPIHDIDKLTVISHENSAGSSHHVEVPIVEGPDSLVVLSKDVQGLVRTHTVSRNPILYPFGPIAIQYGERPWFIPGSGTVTTKYYRFNPDRIVGIVVDSSRCPCDPNAPDALAVNITQPVSSETDQRVITIEGTVGDPNVTSGGTLTVNGTPQNIAVTDGTFSATVVLRSGDNTIAISVETPDGRRGCTQRVIHSSTPKTSISATLTWNLDGADVDLYVTQPDGLTAWYQGKNPPMGGRLDVDNTQGFGPENYFFSAPEGNTIPGGVYSIRVHYYSDHRQDQDHPTRSVTWRVVLLLDEGTPREMREIFTGSLSAANSSNAQPGSGGADWATAKDLNYVPPTP